MQHSIERTSKLPAILRWTVPGRAVVFVLAAASIWCLLADFYHLCSMRAFTFAVLIPATLVLIAMAIIDRTRGDGRLWRAVLIGSIGGFVAACSYDIFRLPWVIGFAQQVGPSWLRLPLFKVFPIFGQMILGQPTDQTPTLAAHVIGWIYHFSNGVTFGVMYIALIGDATQRTWMWAIALAVGIEIALLVTPYTSLFAIKMTVLFVAVTLIAHMIFGIALGLLARYLSRNTAPLHAVTVIA
jgi:hypothetical protein